MHWFTITGREHLQLEIDIPLGPLPVAQTLLIPRFEQWNMMPRRAKLRDSVLTHRLDDVRQHYVAFQAEEYSRLATGNRYDFFIVPLCPLDTIYATMKLSDDAISSVSAFMPAGPKLKLAIVLLKGAD